MIPKLAVALLPLLAVELGAMWPEFALRETFAGQIEQESCISLSHPRCWNPRVELKTSREYGFGLGQTTIAYNANGSERFNSFLEAKRQFRELKDWTWDARFEPAYQMRTMILMDRKCWIGVPWAKDGYQRTALMLVCYNSGAGGIVKDRQLCRQVEGCDPDRWYGNIESHSLKARVAAKGYGKSFFEISREYPKNIQQVRAPKYAPYLEARHG